MKSGKSRPRMTVSCSAAADVYDDYDDDDEEDEDMFF